MINKQNSLSILDRYAINTELADDMFQAVLQISISIDKIIDCKSDIASNKEVIRRNMDILRCQFKDSKEGEVILPYYFKSTV